MQDKGIMHRDIKPGNIFIKDENENKRIKLGDFGCSIYIKDNTSEPIGTIFYAAPEIIKNISYDEKCDLWSLGVTLFELYFDVFLMVFLLLLIQLIVLFIVRKNLY